MIGRGVSASMPFQADLADYCDTKDEDSPLRAQGPPRSAPGAGGCSAGRAAGAASAISSLTPWTMALRGSVLGALAFPSERVWLRALLLGWRRLTSSSVGGPSTGQCGDLVVSSLGEALEALEDFTDSPSTGAAGVVLRLRHLHNMLGEEWSERVAAAGSDSEGDSRMNTASSVGTDGSSVDFFHQRLQSLLLRWPQAVEKVRDRSPPRTRRRNGESLGRAKLVTLRETIIREGCYQRLRGALSFAASIWANAYESTEEAAFKAAAKRACSVLFALDAVTHALPGQVLGTEEGSFGIQEFSRLEELPPALLESLQQLGPL